MRRLPQKFIDAVCAYRIVEALLDRTEPCTRESKVLSRVRWWLMLRLAQQAEWVVLDHADEEDARALEVLACHE